MTGEHDLKTLLASMRPQLLADEYVFCTFKEAAYGDHAELAPIAMMVEQEGTTLVIPRIKADEATLSYSSIQRCISLKVHSSLDAVGLTAAISKALADASISANVIAGFYHDHIFVQSELAEQAVKALEALSAHAK